MYPFVGAWHEQLAALERAFPSNDSARNPFEELAVVCKQQLRTWLSIELEDAARVKYLWGLKDFSNAGYALDVFSLNYDPAVEVSLHTNRGPVNVEWTAGFDESGWNPTLLNKELPVRLFKLHGLLDWVRDEKIGLCSLQWPPAMDSEEIPESADSLLIFGTDAKLQAVEPFLTLLYWFQQCLFDTVALIVIGYSFGDRHVNDVIWEALQRDAKKRCIVVNGSGIPPMLSAEPKLARLAEVENRFRAVEATAKDAFESNSALAALKQVLNEQASEEPF
ncbi:MAG: SIR2 family protein [Thermoanaerobaculia bacterium]